MKLKIYTETTSLEEWTLDSEQIKKFCDYMRSKESWNTDHWKNKSDYWVIKQIENNADKYNDKMRTWLYDNLEYPRKEWPGEEGAYLFYKETLKAEKDA
tara:strand:- start:797 stop:1093 length:297 start_codon:yes stop_codon:yes gene_type:complete